MGPAHDDRFTVKRVICERHRAIGEAADVWFQNAKDDPSLVKHGILWQTIHDEEVAHG